MASQRGLLRCKRRLHLLSGVVNAEQQRGCCRVEVLGAVGELPANFFMTLARAAVLLWFRYRHTNPCRVPSHGLGVPKRRTGQADRPNPGRQPGSTSRRSIRSACSRYVLRSQSFP